MDNEKKPLKLTEGGMATFFAGMALQYNPKIDPELNVVFQFNLENENFYLIVNKGICAAYRGSHQNPTITIITPADIWMKISTGELDGAKAYLKKLYKVEGDINLLLNLSKYFSGSDTQRETSKEQQKALKDFEKIPEHRGPIKIHGMLWLNIAFLPWIILWIWGSFSSTLLPVIICTIISLIITLYHLITNRPTLFEVGTSIYLIIASVLYLIGIEFFIIYFKVINYIFLSGLWLGSLLRYFCLTAEYSRLAFPKQIWSTLAFLKTNDVICGVWGAYFILAAILNLIMLLYSNLYIILMIISYVSLIPMFAFTSWFQNWYPLKVLAK